jgi:hypothetical protein
MVKMKQCCESLYPSYVITHDSNHIQEYHNFKRLKFYGTLHDVIKLVTKWKGLWVFQFANSQKQKNLENFGFDFKNVLWVYNNFGSTTTYNSFGHIHNHVPKKMV